MLLLVLFWRRMRGLLVSDFGRGSVFFGVMNRLKQSTQNLLLDDVHILWMWHEAMYLQQQLTLLLGSSSAIVPSHAIIRSCGAGLLTPQQSLQPAPDSYTSWPDLPIPLSILQQAQVVNVVGLSIFSVYPLSKSSEVSLTSAHNFFCLVCRPLVPTYNHECGECVRDAH